MSRFLQPRTWISPSSMLLKMRLGEAPENTPVLLDVNQGVQYPATRIDGGPIDRIVRAFAGGLKAARLFPAAASTANVGRRHLGYDDVEQLTGVARTFLLRLAPGGSVEHLTDRLRQVPAVESVSPNYISVMPFDVEACGDCDPVPGDSSRQMVRMVEALAYEPGDPSILLGLIDSGIEPSHKELSGVFRPGYDTVRLHAYDVPSDCFLLGDYEQGDFYPTDQFVGHGMGCAGIIAAVGLHMPVGLAGQVRIIPMRALGAVKMPGKEQPVGLGAISDLDMAMKLAVDLGAKVINMSFGTNDEAIDPSGPRPHAEIIEYALAKGCILIAASGNDGGETRYWPAAYPDVITVGAVNALGMPAVFSTRGSHVDLCAPGEKVLTTALVGYQQATGTSFAAPFVSATTALLVSRAARRVTPLDSALVKDILTRSAQPFAQGGSVSGCGAGILDAAAALELLDRHIDQTIE